MKKIMAKDNMELKSQNQSLQKKDARKPSKVC